jgi:hypothetical protein
MGEPEAKRPTDKPRCRRESNIKIDLKVLELECVDWILLPQGSDQ